MSILALFLIFWVTVSCIDGFFVERYTEPPIRLEHYQIKTVSGFKELCYEAFRNIEKYGGTVDIDEVNLKIGFQVNMPKRVSVCKFTLSEFNRFYSESDDKLKFIVEYVYFIPANILFELDEIAYDIADKIFWRLYKLQNK